MIEGRDPLVQWARVAARAAREPGAASHAAAPRALVSRPSFAVHEQGAGMPGPLEGIRVLDLTRNVAGPYATKLLADFGADVLKAEPPGGDPARRFGPFPGDESHLERSALFLHLHTNKRSVVLDALTPAGAAEVRELAAGADIVFEDFAPDEAAQCGWGWNVLSASHPELVMASITPFGQTGPYRDYKGSEITLQAIGGPLVTTGDGRREPLKLGGEVAHYHAGIAAALGALLALRRVEAGGPGDHIDLAVYECQAGFRDRRTIAITAASYTGMAGRRPEAGSVVATGVRPCADGYVNVVAMRDRRALLEMIERPDLLDHPAIDAPLRRMPQDLADEIEGSYIAWLMQRTKLEVVHEAQSRKILCGAILTIDDLLKDRAYRDRGMWETIEHPETGALEYAGRPFIMSASPRPQPRRAPLLGEHDGTPAWPQPRVTPPGSLHAPEAGTLPLDGVRVVDLTVVWAGPHVTQLLGEWGAEVIRPEPVNRIQPSSRGAETILTKEQALASAQAGQLLASYPDFDPKDDPWNRSASFNSHGRNKLSMACDITSPEGREAFLQLIAHSDVLVENNVPETIEKARITWDDLRKVNPRLIMVQMPGYGLTGPYRNYRVFGTHAEGMVGYHHLRSYPDAGPEYAGNALTPDGIAGVLGAVAVLMGLRHRERSGEGQHIELPLAESFLPVIGEFILDHSMNGRDTDPQGNSHRWHAPHNLYPCAGDDRWIAIDVATEDEFAALCKVLGRPELASDERYASVESRRANLAALDSELAALTADRDAEVLFHELQAAGVCAAPTHTALQALNDPQLVERGFFPELTMAGVGTHRYPGSMFKMANTPNPIRLPPPLLGEHNEQIYLDLLGYSREDYDALVDRGFVGTRYPDEVLGR